LGQSQEGLGGPIYATISERSFIFRGHVFSQDAYEVEVLDLSQLYRVCASHLSSDPIRSVDGDQRGALYVAEEASGVAVLDIVDPCNLFEANRLAPSTGYRSARLQVAPNRLFVTESAPAGGGWRQWNLRVYDQSIATSPQLLDTIFVGYTQGGSVPGTVVPIGNRYVGVQFDNHSMTYPPGQVRHGLHIVDLQTRSIVSHITSLWATPNFWTYGRYLYAATPDSGYEGHLSVWDMANPAAPVPRGSVLYNGATSDWRTLTMVNQGTRLLAVFGVEAAYGAEGPGAMVIMDVTDPDAPFYVTEELLEETPGGYYILSGDMDGIGNQVFIWGWAPNFGQGYDYYLVVYDVTHPSSPIRQRFQHLPTLLAP
jgi:hypothetical protein